MRSDSSVATVLGVISPKMRISRVSTPVAIPAKRLPNTSVTSTVTMEEADRFTTLLPIRMALNMRAWFSPNFITYPACLSPASARLRIRILLTVVNAVSEEEKKADSAKRIKITNNRMPTVSLDKSIINSCYSQNFC